MNAAVPKMPENCFFRCARRQRLPDNLIFYLHYRWTVLMLVAFGIIVSCKLLVRNSFSCKTREPIDDIRCYSSNSLYTIPGLGPDPSVIRSGVREVKTDYLRYQYYYTWVNLLLFLHAFNFYLPHLLWKSFKLEYISRLISSIETAGAKENERAKELCYIAKHILLTQGNHKNYTITYIMCEVLNFVVAVSHVSWLVKFFNVTGVPDSLDVQMVTWDDFKTFYFPSIALCSYQMLGSSGDTQSFSLFCLLPMNELYMLLYLILRSWYTFLAILSGTVFVYRIVLMFPFLRMYVTSFNSPLSDKTTVRTLCYKMSYSDWFFLTRFKKVLNDVDFAQMMDKIVFLSRRQTSVIQQGHDISLSCEINKEVDSSTL